MNWRPFKLPATLPVTWIFSHYPTRSQKALPVTAWLPLSVVGGVIFQTLHILTFIFICVIIAIYVLLSTSTFYNS